MSLSSGLSRNHVYGIIITILLIFVIVETPFLLYRLFPLWFIGAVVVAAAIYGFDNLPYQHYWNPSVRELYPYYQSWPEQTVMALLHRTNVFHSRRWRKKTQLPPELWIKIILSTVDFPSEFDAHCAPKDFHRFAKGHSFHHSHPWNFLEWISGARRVSRLWETILNQHADMWVVKGWSRSTQTQLSRWTRRVDFGIDSPDSYLYPTVPVTDQDEANLSVSLPELSVVSVSTVLRAPKQVYNALSEGVFAHAAKFSAAESFILATNGGHLISEALSGIETSFSHITSLTLTADQIDGILSLERLEVLILSAKRADTRAWSLPRLTHLALSADEESGLFYDKDLFPGSCQRLRSLHLSPAQTLDADEKFWSDHPVLEYLGVISSKFQLTHSPPADHPLAHIYFWDSKSPITNMDLQHVTQVFAGIPRLRTAVLPRHNRFDKAQAYPVEWWALAGLERSKGAQWFDPSGREINTPEPLRERHVRRQWEEWWVRSWGLYFIYNLVNFCASNDLYGKQVNTAMPILISLWIMFVVWDTYR